MVNILRVLYYIPWGILGFFNVSFLSLIYIIRNIGNGIVWINNKISDYGDYFGDKARDNEKLEIFIKKMEEEKRRLK